MDLSRISTKGLEVLAKNKGDINKSLSELPDDDLYMLEEMLKPKAQPEAGLGEKIGRGLLASVPAVTGIAGGLAGSVVGPAGALGGGALGYAGGRQLEKLGKAAFFGEKPESRQELYGGALEDVAVGGAAELGGQVIGKAIEPIGRGLVKTGKALKTAYEYTKAVPKGNAEEILAAGKAVGVEPTRGMLTDSRLVGELESGLAQSGSLPALEIRKQQDVLASQLEASTGKLTSRASDQTAFESGNIAKQNIADVISQNKAPVTEMYEKLEPDFLNIPIDLKETNRGLGVLKRQTMFKTKDGQAVLDKVTEDISSLSNLADLKEYRTNLLRSIPNTASDLDKMRLTEIYKKITDIRDNSIAALQMKPEFKFAPGGASKELSQTVDQIAQADAAHRSNMESINKVRHLFGQKEPFVSQSEFIKKVQEIPNQHLTEKVFTSGNVTELKSFSEQFPEAFGQMKIQKVSDMIQKATSKQGFNFNQFNKSYEKLDPNIRDLIFDPETKSYVGALKTVFESLPQRLGPSGTPQGLMTMSGLDTGRILNDMWAKYIYKNSTPQGAMILNTLGSNLEVVGSGMQQPFSPIANIGRAVPMGINAIERRKQTLDQGAK